MTKIPFSDKYRPKRLNELIIDDIIYNKLKNIIDSKDVPNMIFTGKSGVGKTSSIHIIAKLSPIRSMNSCCLIIYSGVMYINLCLP